MENGFGAISQQNAARKTANCFYLLGSYQYPANGQTTYAGATAKDEAYMKSQEFVDALNNGGDNWTRDNNINEGYPILKSINYQRAQ